MAGEIPNVNMGAYNNPYAVPYLNTNNSYNDDFMASQIFNQPQTQIPAAQGGVPNFQGQPNADVFQRQSSGGIGTMPLAILAGGAGTAGGYYFANPFKEEGVFDEKMLNSIDKEVVQSAEKMHYEKLYEKKIGYDKKTMDAIQSLSEKGKAGITDAEKELLKKANITTKKQAQKITSKAAGIDTQALAEEAKKIARVESYTHNTNLLNRMKGIKPSLETLKDADLTDFIKKNHDLFNIHGKEDEIAKAAETLAQKGSKAVSAKLTSNITAKEKLVKKLADNITKSNVSYFEKGGRKLVNDAPETISKAFKNFKWKKAGKIGIIAACAGLLIGLFSNSGKKV